MIDGPLETLSDCLGSEIPVALSGSTVYARARLSSLIVAKSANARRDPSEEFSQAFGPTPLSREDKDL